MKKLIILAGIIALIIISWVMYFNKTNPIVSEVENNQETIKEKVYLAIDSGDSVQTFDINFSEGLTAFDLLEEKTNELNKALKTEVYDFGVLVVAIGDKENGEDGRYWLYYVNGEMPMVSADKMELKSGDKVEFKFEKSPF